MIMNWQDWLCNHIQVKLWNEPVDINLDGFADSNPNKQPSTSLPAVEELKDRRWYIGIQIKF